MNQTVKPKVMLVDDEPNLIEAVALHLRRGFQVLTATGGSEALVLLQANPDTAVIISDMRMPQMNGATFLAKARQLLPESVRMLLTGQTELGAAVSAVNEGQIFRFLTKPCASPQLLAAVEAAVAQHRLLTAEKVLLEQTLQGSIRALTEVLALVSPQVFGRGTRIKRLVSTLAAAADLPQRWQVEMSAMLSQLGLATLPAETAEKMRSRQTLSDDERQMVARLPQVTDQLLAHIPRLETVRAILAGANKPYRESDYGQPDVAAQHAARSAQLLAIAAAYDELTEHGMSSEDALAALRGHQGRYDPQWLKLLADTTQHTDDLRRVIEVNALGLVPGMLLAEDLATTSGLLVLCGGMEVTISVVERIRNYRPGTLKEPIHVRVGMAKTEQ